MRPVRYCGIVESSVIPTGRQPPDALGTMWSGNALELDERRMIPFPPCTQTQLQRKQVRLEVGGKHEHVPVDHS